MKNTLFALLAVVSAIIAGFFIYRFQTSEVQTSLNIILGVIFAIIAVALGIMFMTSKVGHHEDIHITE